MTSHSTGKLAEDAAAEYLKKNGYKVLDQNWRTRWCEIDIAAEKSKTIYFVEVKYRVSNRQGSGLDYITKKKLEQMKFAAEFWVSENNWRGDYTLAAVEVSGTEFVIVNFLTEL